MSQLNGSNRMKKGWRKGRRGDDVIRKITNLHNICVYRKVSSNVWTGRKTCYPNIGRYRQVKVSPHI